MAAARKPAATDRLRFVHRGAVREIRDVDPTMTVLNWLREAERLTGTKEGCAEGDCGACTVVLGEADGRRIRYRAVNACILFLPVLDGRELITVEDLAGPGGRLHPVQRALVDHHASQCGFCTPGFAMALFALFKTDPAPSRRRIEDALAGNLCRCTGYRPIVDAALAMGREGAADRFSEREAETLRLLRRIRRRRTLALARDGRRYYAPVDLDSLAALVRRHPDAVLLAGGTDVGLQVTKAHRDLATVIHLGDVAELKRLDVAGGHLEIGAAVTYADAAAAIAEAYPDFGEIVRRLGSEQIRNVGTIAGNVANASPIGDTMPALLALGATAILRRGARRREVALDDFFLDYRRTALAPGEFIERIRLPLPQPGRLFRAYKISKRFDQDISAVCGAFSLALDGDRVREIRIAFGGMAATPKRAAHCERALAGGVWSEVRIAAAARALERDFAPISDMRASGAYRMTVARNLLRKFYFETAGPGAAGAAAATDPSPRPPTRVLAVGR